MKVVHRSTLFGALSIAPLLLCLAGSGTAFSPGTAGEGAAPPSCAHQFYTRVLGDWVGTTACRVNDAEPALGYFHVLISRVDENTFREEYTFYRLHPKTGALERSGTQSLLCTIENSGTIHEVCRGSGSILIDFEPKNQCFEASGEAQFSGPDHLEAELKGKIAVAGMPMNLGKNGKLRKATATWSLQDERLIGQLHVETSFHALLVTKRYRFETQFRAQRGVDVQSVAGRAPAS
jgi:hypothetical protein